MFVRILHQLTSRKGDLWMLSAKWSAPFIGLIGGLVTAKFLTPTEMGVFQGVMLVPTYVAIIQFGVFSGLSRNLPLYRARQEPEKAQVYADASAKMARWVGFVGASFGLFAVYYFIFQSTDTLHLYLALFLIPLLFFSPVQLHLSSIHRGMMNFEQVGKSIHIQNLWNLLCSLSTSIIGVHGIALKMAGNNLVIWGVLRKNIPIQDQKSASWGDVLDLSKVGMPVMISGLIGGWLAASDRTIIAACLTTEDLGYFALAGIAANSIKIFPSSISMLLYPRIARDFGKTGSSRSLRRFIWIGIGLNLVVMGPIAIIGWFGIPYFVKAFLPAYSQGIQAAQIVAVGALFQVYAGANAIIPILRKNWLPNALGILSIGLVWLAGIWAVRNGYGINGIAVARVAVTALYGTFVIGFVYYLTGRDIVCEN